MSIKTIFNRYISYCNIHLYYIYTHPNLPKYLIYTYNFIRFIFIFIIFSFSNIDFIFELFNLLSSNYLVLLHEDFFINITSGLGNNNNNPLGIGSSNTGDSGPPNPNPNQLFGDKPAFEIENYKKRREEELEKQPDKPVFNEPPHNKFLGKEPLFKNKRPVEPILDEHTSKRLKGKQPVYNDTSNQIEQANYVEQSNNLNQLLPNKNIAPKGKMQIEPLKKPTSLFREIIRKKHVRLDGHFTRQIPQERFVYYDPIEKRSHNPEVLHLENSNNLHDNNIRVFNEHSLQYTYNCMSSDPSKHFCKVTYPDLSMCYIYRTQTMVDNIMFHRKHVTLGYEMDPKFSYDKYYKQHFDVFRKQKVEALLKKYNIINSNRVIEPNTIPKDNNNPKLFDVNSNKTLILDNKDFLSEPVKNYKYLFANGR